MQKCTKNLNLSLCKVDTPASPKRPGSSLAFSYDTVTMDTEKVSSVCP